MQALETMSRSALIRELQFFRATKRLSPRQRDTARLAVLTMESKAVKATLRRAQLRKEELAHELARTCIQDAQSALAPGRHRHSIASAAQ